MQSANTKLNTKQLTNDVRSVQALTTRGRGIAKGNPKRCLVCATPIRENDAWVKLTSPNDPQYGSYSVIVHETCNRATR